MLEKLFAAFRKSEAAEQVTDPLPRAVGALLVEAARGDEVYTDEEKTLIDDILARQFSLSVPDAAAIRAEAEEAQAAANDMYSFSRIVKDQLDYDAKCQLIEDMWAIALSDADKAPYEEMIIRRLIGLIHVDDRDSQAARHRASTRLGHG